VVTVDTTRRRPPAPHVPAERTAISASSPRDYRAAVAVGLLGGAGLAGFVIGSAGIGVAVVEWVALIALIGAALFAIASVALTVVQYRRGEHR
jgi:hypothetical protein